LVLFALLAWWAFNVLPLPKLEFNQTNPYTFMIPLLTYIYFRNCTREMRGAHLGLLASIGKYTLETYLLQHHVWLTSNAKTVLVFVPGYPKVNLLVVTVVYVLVSRRLYRATMVTRAMLVPEDPGRCLVFLGYLGGILGLAGITASLLQWGGAPWIVVAAASAAGGLAALSAVKVSIRVTAVEGLTKARARTPWTQALLVSAAGMTLCLTGLWLLPAVAPSGAPANAGPLRSARVAHPSQTDCLQAVWQGSWAEHACASKGGAFCSSGSWDWSDPVMQRACQFSHLSQSEARRVLADKNLVFIGDDSLFYVYAALRGLALQPSTPLAGAAAMGYGFIDSFQCETGSSTVSFVFAQNAAQAGKALENTPGQSLLVFGAWMRDKQDGAELSQVVNGWLQVGQRASDRAAGAILVPPPASAGTLADAFSSSQVASAFTATLPMDQVTEGRRAVDSVDGVRFAGPTAQTAAQVLLNAIKQISPPAKPKSGFNTQAKGNGGGVAHSPLYGAATLFVAALMIVTMDNYAGIAFLMGRFIPKSPPRITWEESVRELHVKFKIGANDNSDEERKGLVLTQRSHASVD
jgi:hypothetical protein